MPLGRRAEPGLIFGAGGELPAHGGDLIQAPQLIKGTALPTIKALSDMDLASFTGLASFTALGALSPDLDGPGEAPVDRGELSVLMLLTC